MSVESRIWLLHRVGLAFLLTGLFAPQREAGAATWESFINVFPIPQTAYQDATVEDILRDIENKVREQADETELPPLHFVLQSSPDISRRLSLTVPELSAGFAMSFVIRQANLGSELIRNDLFIFPAPSREAGMRALEIELSAREILFLNLGRNPGDVEPDVLELARDTLLSTRVFRTGPNSVGVVPMEFAALALILRGAEPAVFLDEVLKSGQPAGRLYALAGLRHLGTSATMPEISRAVPTVLQGERKIILSDADRLYEQHIVNGELVTRVLDGTETANRHKP